MVRGYRRPTPALLISLIALFVALGGTVYAAGKINGKTIKVKSLPGNRLRPGSVPGNRLKPGAIEANRLQPNSIGGAQVDEQSLGPVPSAIHAETADSADDAQTALNAVNAVNAMTVNGHGAGCLPGTRFFAGACWQSFPSATAATAPNAAIGCAAAGGELPEALQLAAFSQQPGVSLDSGDEWASDLTSYTSPNAYSSATVSAGAVISSSVVGSTKKYRCVIPLVT
jgi:hypothetical protein